MNELEACRRELEEMRRINEEQSKIVAHLEYDTGEARERAEAAEGKLAALRGAMESGDSGVDREGRRRQSLHQPRENQFFW